MSRWVARVRVRSRARSAHVSFEVVAILRHGVWWGRACWPFEGRVSVRRSLRSLEPGCRDRSAVRDGGSAVVGILPFADQSTTGVFNMQ